MFAATGTHRVGQSIDNGRLHLLAVLGIGAYGVVYLAQDEDGGYLAVKCLVRAGIDSYQREFQRREIRLHALASGHPNVVSLRRIVEEEDCIFVVLDFCDGGDLFGMITDKRRYLGNDELIKRVFLQIIGAVKHCHKLGIYHRDLKPENILCLGGGERVCLADFGLATTETLSAEFGCGSTFYLSPECQGDLFKRLKCYSTKSTDIWSLGVILVNLACGRNPWRQASPNDETFRAYLENRDFLQTILPVSNETHAILKRLFVLEPADRISLQELEDMVRKVERFTMTEKELETASAVVREAAAFARQPVVCVARADSLQAPKRLPLVGKVDGCLDMYAYRPQHGRYVHGQQDRCESIALSSPTWSSVSEGVGDESDMDYEPNSYLSVSCNVAQYHQPSAYALYNVQNDSPFVRERENYTSLSRSTSSSNSLLITPGLVLEGKKVIEYQDRYKHGLDERDRKETKTKLDEIPAIKRYDGVGLDGMEEARVEYVF
nr:RAN protein kinase [Cryptococcus depauperatus CBS 7841]